MDCNVRVDVIVDIRSYGITYTYTESGPMSLLIHCSMCNKPTENHGSVLITSNDTFNRQTILYLILKSFFQLPAHN